MFNLQLFNNNNNVYEKTCYNNDCSVISNDT
jgi:hypothetical protein